MSDSAHEKLSHSIATLGTFFGLSVLWGYKITPQKENMVTLQIQRFYDKNRYELYGIL